LEGRSPANSGTDRMKEEGVDQLGEIGVPLDAMESGLDV
jgi:hypothetical protein